MLLSKKIVPAPASYRPLTEVHGFGFAATTKQGFITFFWGKGFTCATDAQQQLKATGNKLTVRLSVNDSKIDCGQGHAICYLSFAPLNRCYKIAVSSTPQTSLAANNYRYTLLKDNFFRGTTVKQTPPAFSSFEALLDAVFPKPVSLAGVQVLQSFFSFLF